MPQVRGQVRQLLSPLSSSSSHSLPFISSFYTTSIHTVHNVKEFHFLINEIKLNTILPNLQFMTIRPTLSTLFRFQKLISRLPIQYPLY